MAQPPCPTPTPTFRFAEAASTLLSHFFQGITQRERLEITFIVDVWQTQNRSVCLCVCRVHTCYSFSLYLIESGSQGLAHIVIESMLIPASHALGSNQWCAVNNRQMWTSSEDIRRQFVLTLGKFVLSKFTINNKQHTYSTFPCFETVKSLFFIAIWVGKRFHYCEEALWLPSEM